MYVLDTNTLIYFFKGEGGVSKRLLSTPPASIGVPTLVVYELETGIAKSTDPAERRAQLDRTRRAAPERRSAVEEGILEARYPETPSHPSQACRARRGTEGADA